MAKTTGIIFNPGNYSGIISVALLLLRLVAGALMLTHGEGKLVMLLSGDPVEFPNPIGVGAEASLVLTVFAEFFCSVLLILGLATRFAAIPLLINMLVIALIVHARDPFGSKELPLLYATIFVVIALFGAGKYSADYLIFRKFKKAKTRRPYRD